MQHRSKVQKSHPNGRENGLKRSSICAILSKSESYSLNAANDHKIFLADIHLVHTSSLLTFALKSKAL